MTTRRFPPPWTVEQIPGGYKVKDANGQSLAYVYGRETRANADIAHVLTRRDVSPVTSPSCPDLQEKPAVEGGPSHSLCFGIRKPKPFSALLRR